MLNIKHIQCSEKFPEAIIGADFIKLCLTLLMNENIWNFSEALE